MMSWGRGLAVMVLGFAVAAASAAELPTFRLVFKPDGRFEPQRLEVPAGKFKIELINESDQPVEFESLPLRKEKVLGPGVRSFVVITISGRENTRSLTISTKTSRARLSCCPNPSYSGFYGSGRIYCLAGEC